jgi:hypothetical protein
MNRKVLSLLAGLSIVSLTLLQACTSLPKTSDAAPAPKTNVSAIAPANNRTETTPPVISSEPLPIADARPVTSDRASSPKQPKSCAREDYGQFFWQFVKDNDMSNNPMRMPYSAASITVRNYENPDQVLEVVKKQNYQGFKIDSVDYTLVYDDPTITDPKAKARLKREVKRLDDNTFRVDYVRAEFETDGEAEDNNGKLIRTYGAPGAYIFEHQNGCWTLTQEYRSQVTGSDRAAGPVTGTDRTAKPQIPAVEALLIKGMTDVELRKILSKSGWVPLVSADEKEDVNACSGNGYCRTFYEDKTTGIRLKVITYGREQSLEDWEFRKDGMPLR